MATTWDYAYRKLVWDFAAGFTRFDEQLVARILAANGKTEADMHREGGMLKRRFERFTGGSPWWPKSVPVPRVVKCFGNVPYAI